MNKILLLLIVLSLSCNFCFSYRTYTYNLQLLTSQTPHYNSTLDTNQTSWWIETPTSNSAYIETPSLTFTVGDVITFELNQTARGYAFEICTSTDCGANVTNLCTGAGLGPHIAGDTCSWTVPNVLTPNTYFYGDRFHSYMGAPITIVQKSICQRYTEALNGGNSTIADQQALIGSLLGRFITGCNTTAGDNCGRVGSFIGVSNPTHPLWPFFVGHILSDLRTGPVNFLIPGPAQTILVSNLTSFFGHALGCPGQGTTPYPKGLGNFPGKTLFQIHQGMDIDQTQFSSFRNTFGLSGASYGVSDLDLLTIYDYLETFGFIDANNPGPNEICQDETTCNLASLPDTNFPIFAEYANCSSSYFSYKVGIIVENSIIGGILVCWLLYLTYSASNGRTYYASNTVE